MIPKGIPPLNMGFKGMIPKGIPPLNSLSAGKLKIPPTSLDSFKNPLPGMPSSAMQNDSHSLGNPSTNSLIGKINAGVTPKRRHIIKIGHNQTKKSGMLNSVKNAFKATMKNKEADFKKAFDSLNDKISKFKQYPLYKLVVNSYASIFENSTLFDKIRQTTNIDYGQYSSFVKDLNQKGLENYNYARCLIHRYYHKNIAINYSFLRESKDIKEIGKDKKYMEAHIKLLNSTPDKDIEHFNAVFNNKDQFTKLNKKIVDGSMSISQIKEEIEKAFIITDDTPDKNETNCSYLILYILYDIHYQIDEANELMKQLKENGKAVKNPLVLDEEIEEIDDIKTSCPQHTDIDSEFGGGIPDIVLDAAVVTTGKSED